MYHVNNKFEIGEECYSIYRKPIDVECPICKGEGSFSYNEYNVECIGCRGSGRLHIPKQYIMATCRVTVRRVIASIWKDHITIKYKVDCNDDFANAHNRSENTLFKTKEDAEKYCAGVNTKQVVSEI